MKSPFFKIYLYITIISILLCVGLGIYDLKANSRQYYSFDSFERWDDYEVKYHNNYTELKGTVSVKNINTNQLAFYSSHQEYEIYCNGYVYYKYPVINNNPLAKTSGYAWHFISFPEGKNDVTILISSPYRQHVNRIPIFYLGNALAIASNLFINNLPTFLICVIILFLGVNAILLWISMKIKKIPSDILLYLGIFGILISLWSMNESTMSVLLFQNNIANSYLSFILLHSLPIPVSLFIKELYNIKSKRWNIYIGFALIQIIVVDLLQLFKIADFRNTLFLTHINIVLLAVLLVTYSIHLIRSKTASKLVYIHLIAVLIYSGTLIIDLVAYYIGMWDNNVFGRIGLSIYFLIIGFFSLNESTSLMKKGLQSKKIEKLAFTDSLTGVKNRTAFNRDLEAIEANPLDTVLINLDINNLKKSNDTYGHFYGDIYIKSVSDIITNIFSSIGEIYRTGGDEFEVVIKNGTFFNIDKYLEKLELEIKTTEWDNKQPWMTIAHGYASFDPSIDKTVMDTYKRADQKMYADKKIKKTQMV